MKQINTKQIENYVDMIIIGFSGYIITLIVVCLIKTFNPDWLFTQTILLFLSLSLLVTGIVGIVKAKRWTMRHTNY